MILKLNIIKAFNIDKVSIGQGKVWELCILHLGGGKIRKYGKNVRQFNTWDNLGIDYFIHYVSKWILTCVERKKSTTPLN